MNRTIADDFFFQAGKRRLCGRLVLPPDSAARSVCGFLFCAPFADEQFFVAPLAAACAERLGRSGFAALRFDYGGCGNSEGASRDADFDAWLADIARAAEVFAEKARIRNIVPVGVRLGALAAALAADHCPLPVAGMSLWDPVVSGREHIAEKRRERTIRRALLTEDEDEDEEEGGALDDGGEDFAGCVVGASFVQQVEGVRFDAPTESIRCPVQIIHMTGAVKLERPIRAFAERIARRGIPVTTDVVTGPPFWAGFTKVGFNEVVDAVVAWAAHLEGAGAIPTAGEGNR